MKDEREDGREESVVALLHRHPEVAQRIPDHNLELGIFPSRARLDASPLQRAFGRRGDTRYHLNVNNREFATIDGYLRRGAVEKLSATKRACQSDSATRGAMH